MTFSVMTFSIRTISISTFSIVTFFIMTFSIMKFSDLKHYGIQLNDHVQKVTMLILMTLRMTPKTITLSITILSISVKRRHSGRYKRHAACRSLAAMLSASVSSVILLRVEAPFSMTCLKWLCQFLLNSLRSNTTNKTSPNCYLRERKTNRERKKGES